MTADNKSSTNTDSLEAIKAQIKVHYENLLEVHHLEVNDQITRDSFKKSIGDFIASLLTKNILSDFQIQCDETNNPSESIQQGLLVIDIWIPKSSHAPDGLMISLPGTNTKD